MSAGERLPGTPLPMHVWKTGEGLRIAGDAWGDPEGALVLLLHGGGQTRHAWKGAGEKLGEAGYRVVALDARGHGDSDWAPDGDYTQDAMVRDLQSVLTALDQPRPVLVGASMGGSACLVAAGEGKVDAAALVLVDIAPRVELDGAERIVRFMLRNPDGFGSLEEVADAIASYQPQRKRPRSLDGLAKNVRLAPNGRYRWHWDPNLHLKHTDRDWRRRRFEACARNLGMPTLLVRGALSDLLSEEGAREFLALCPHAEYVNVGGASHMVAGDRNDVFGSAVIDFLLRRVPAGE